MMRWVKLFKNETEAWDKIAERRGVLAKIGSRRICIARFDNKLLAIDDTCPHRGESLSKGVVNNLGQMVCPWHSYRFQLKDGMSCQPECADASSFVVKTKKDGVYLGLPDKF